MLQDFLVWLMELHRFFTNDPSVFISSNEKKEVKLPTYPGNLSKLLKFTVSQQITVYFCLDRQKGLPHSRSAFLTGFKWSNVFSISICIQLCIREQISALPMLQEKDAGFSSCISFSTWRTHSTIHQNEVSSSPSRDSNQQRYIEDSQSLRSYLAAIHLLKELPQLIVVDDLSSFCSG